MTVLQIELRKKFNIPFEITNLIQIELDKYASNQLEILTRAKLLGWKYFFKGHPGRFQYIKNIKNIVFSPFEMEILLYNARCDSKGYPIKIGIWDFDNFNPHRINCIL